MLRRSCCAAYGSSAPPADTYLRPYPAARRKSPQSSCGGYFSIEGDFLCYLLTVAATLTTNILLLLIFVNIILILTLLPALPGILLSVSGISIYLLPILLWLINILNSVRHQELLPVEAVPFLDSFSYDFSLCFRWIVIII